jgi:plasmid stabilization system protein ParE
MAVSVSLHPRARDEVEEAQSWYEERSLLAAAGFLQELSRAIRRISEAPSRYPIALHGTRRVVLDRFPFNIFYRVSIESVVIVAFAHQKRRPGYWVDR